jgi:hypothetical protein
LRRAKDKRLSHDLPMQELFIRTAAATMNLLKKTPTSGDK